MEDGERVQWIQYPPHYPNKRPPKPQYNTTNNPE